LQYLLSTRCAEAVVQLSRICAVRLPWLRLCSHGQLHDFCNGSRSRVAGAFRYGSLYFGGCRGASRPDWRDGPSTRFPLKAPTPHHKRVVVRASLNLFDNGDTVSTTTRRVTLGQQGEEADSMARCCIFHLQSRQHDPFEFTRTRISNDSTTLFSLPSFQAPNRTCLALLH